MQGKFKLVFHQQYTRDLNAAIDGLRVSAIHISDPGKSGSGDDWVILVEHTVPRQHIEYCAYFYRDNKSMLAAFRAGLIDYLRDRNDPTPNFYAGYSKKLELKIGIDDNRKPWFMANEEDTIDGEVAITPHFSEIGG